MIVDTSFVLVKMQYLKILGVAIQNMTPLFPVV